MNSSLYLRKATESDMDLLLEWANDETVRQNAFNTSPISYDEHRAWFSKMMADEKEAQYILMNGDVPVGQVRLTIDEDEAVIGYSIDKNERGKGYGKEIIRLVRERISEDYPQVVKLIGKVKPNNRASLFCFKKNGFEELYRCFEYYLNFSKT